MFRGITNTLTRVVSKMAKGVVRYRAIIGFLAFFLLSNIGLAEDFLSGTAQGLVDTLSFGGTGRTFIYLVEAVAGTITLIATRGHIGKGFLVIIAVEVFLRMIWKLGRI